MHQISAKVIKDSVGEYSPRLTTLQLRLPRIILAEMNTHRMISKNASSSRAIPVKRLIQDVMDNPYIPVHWGKNQKGMQAYEENDELVEILYEDGFEFVNNKTAWLKARNNAVEFAKAFDAAGYHKQIVNRLIEPYMYTNIVATATNWANFLYLRDHHAAQPEIQILAQCVKSALETSVPEELSYGEWHLPYITDEDRKEYNQEDIKKISAARCARVSYKTVEGKRPTAEEDLVLFDRLVNGDRIHASPLEHQASPDWFDDKNDSWKNKELHGNFNGWIQYRKTIPNESVK